MVSLGPRISPPLMIRVIVMDWSWIVVSDGEVCIMVIQIYLVKGSMLDCVTQLELARVKPLNSRTV